MPIVAALSVAAAGVFSALKISDPAQLWMFPVSFAVCLIAFSLLYWLLLWLCCFYIPVGKEYEKPSRFHLFLLNAAYWFFARRRKRLGSRRRCVVGG